MQFLNICRLKIKTTSSQSYCRSVNKKFLWHIIVNFSLIFSFLKKEKFYFLNFLFQSLILSIPLSLKDKHKKNNKIIKKITMYNYVCTQSSHENIQGSEPQQKSPAPPLPHSLCNICNISLLQTATMKTEKTTEAWSAKLGRGSPARSGMLTHLTGLSMTNISCYIYTHLRKMCPFPIAY